MSLKYFGTDGVRGRALVSPLSLEEVARWGRAWGQVAKARGAEELVLGWDPRLSSEPMAQAFALGLGDQLKLCVLGMVPTPAVAWVTQQRPGAWGLMLSASHNPPEDNGIKGFDGAGEKLSEEDEQAIEAAFEATAPIPGEPPVLAFETALMERYLESLGGLELPADFKIVVDCAHGATAPWASRLLKGGQIQWIGTPAEGACINVGVGSTHLEPLQEAVRTSGAAVGIAFDGDGDRCLLVDPMGNVVDGDQIMWLMVQDLHSLGEPVSGVVGTVMSNGGLEESLKGLGIPFSRTQVGDKFMLRELSARQWDLAAEASGHVIQKHLGPSGDGLSTAIACLKALLHRSPEARWAWCFRPWPLKLVNLKATERKPVDACPQLKQAIQTMESEHGAGARIVVRWSGTEPKLRLMVEARESAIMEHALVQLEAAARADLGL